MSKVDKRLKTHISPSQSHCLRYTQPSAAFYSTTLSKTIKAGDWVVQTLNWWSYSSFDPAQVSQQALKAAFRRNPDQLQRVLGEWTGLVYRLSLSLPSFFAVAVISILASEMYWYRAFICICPHIVWYFAVLECSQSCLHVPLMVIVAGNCSHWQCTWNGEGNIEQATASHDHFASISSPSFIKLESQACTSTAIVLKSPLFTSDTCLQFIESLNFPAFLTLYEDAEKRAKQVNAVGRLHVSALYPHFPAHKLFSMGSNLDRNRTTCKLWN